MVLKLLQVERVGGLAGYGAGYGAGGGARIRSRGEIAIETLLPADRQAVENLFESPAGASAASAAASPVRDGFRYRITRASQGVAQTIEVPEEALPAAVIGCVKDELL